jgi:hypothetical protein
MTTDTDRRLLRRLVTGGVDTTAGVSSDVVREALTSRSPEVLVAAAVVSGDRQPLDRARPHAVRTRDRQLVALAEALLAGDVELFDALVRDHLAEYPDSVLAAWIAGQTPHHPAHRKADPSC